MLVKQRRISERDKPYIIAELSANYGGDIDSAKQSLQMAAEAGVSVIKSQTYTPDAITGG